MELEFECPKCSGTELIQKCKTYKYIPVSQIIDDGSKFGDVEFDYANMTEDDLEPIVFCCGCCGHELVDAIGEEIWDISDIPNWVKENC